MPLAAAIEPFEHQAMYGMVELTQRTTVVGHPKVVEVPAQLACDRPPQVWQRTRHTFRAEPVVDVDQRTPQPPLGRLAFESYQSSSTLPPEVGKSQEIEGRHPLLRLERPPGLAFAEGEELGLALIQPQDTQSPVEVL